MSVVGGLEAFLEYEKWKCFRVTMDDDAKIVEVCRGTSALVCKEEADAEIKETHYHLLVYTDLTVQTLRLRVYKALGDVENRSRKCAFTTRKKDLEPYKRYICKGLALCKDPTDPNYPKIILNDNKENVQRLHEEFWREYARIEKEREAAQTETKSRASQFHDYFDTLVRREAGKRVQHMTFKKLQKEMLDEMENPDPRVLTIAGCALHALRFYQDKGWPMPTRFHLQQMAVTAFAKHKVYVDGYGPSKEWSLMEFYGFWKSQ